MSARAVILGLLGACVVCGFTYFNDAIMHQTYFVGNNMPIAVYGGLILVVMLVNPLLGRLGPRWTLRGSELAVVLALTLAACCVPSSGLLRTLATTLVMPHHFNRTEAGWKTRQVLDQAPPVMLADVNAENQNDVLGGFIQGLPREADQAHIGIGDVPWSAWSATLGWWLPLVLALWVALIGLSVVLHRQWADHEHLAYPIAAFTNELLPHPGQTRGPVFRRPLFWLGTTAVLLLHLNNFGATCFPQEMVVVQRSVDFSSAMELFPTFKQGAWGMLYNPTIYFTVVAFAFFLAADVSLSMGLGPYVYAWVVGLLAGYGISMRGGGFLEAKPQTFLNFGAHLAMFVGLLFMARHYYAGVFARALGLPGRAPVEAAAVWGARVCLAGLAIFAVMLVGVGVDWPTALLYTLLTVILFVVMSRILAETGAFFIQPWWFPCAVLAGLLGYQAIEPRMLLVLMLVSIVVVVDPREALMPFIMNALKLVDLRRVRVGPTAFWCGVALILGLAVGVPVTFYFQYDRGMNAQDGWATRSVPQFAFDESIRITQRLEAQDQLDGARDGAGWQRLVRIRPNAACGAAFAAGALLVGLVAVGRVRFAHWPLHPVMFLVWSSYPGNTMAASFLLGWLIKVAVVRYGGSGGYQRLKPLMFGLIAGDMLGGLAPILIGLVWYVLSGDPPRNFLIMPG